MEDVPCEDLPTVVAGLVKHGAFKAMRQQLRKTTEAEVAPPATSAPAEKEPDPVGVRAADIPEGSAKLVRVQGEEIAVFKQDGKLCAIQNACPHEGGQLSKGWIEGEAVVCPLHGYKFDLKTGICSSDPHLKAKTFAVTAQGEEFTIDPQKNGERK